MSLGDKVKTDIVKWFYENHKSIVNTQRAFKRNYGTKKSPSKNTIKDIVRKFEEKGSVHDRPRPGPGRCMRTPVNVQKIRSKLEESPHRSLKRLTRETGIKRSTVRRIILDDLKLYSYKIQMLQKQSDPNKMKRLDYARYFAKKIEDKSWKLQNIHWSDEANFHLSGHINKQNMRFWGLSKPDPIAEKPLSTEKLVVWCAITPTIVIGPYFYEDDSGATVTVNAERYLYMLKRYYLPNIRRHRKQNKAIFQQDGAPPHYANIVKYWLRDTFGEQRIIARGFDNFWPAYSPDLNPLDFYLWGALKATVYQDPIPETLEQLKINIKREIRKITPETLKKVYDNVLVRLQKVIGQRGRWIEYLING